jgi:hypothetical protein
MADLDSIAQQLHDLTAKVDLLLARRSSVARARATPRDGHAPDTWTGFNAFWDLYPKKVGRGAAEMEWNKIKPDQPLFDRIMAAVMAHLRSEKWREDGGRFIPNPSTWLHQKRWLDETKTTVIAPVRPKAMQQIPARPNGEPPPPEVREQLSRLMGKDFMRVVREGR